MASEHAAASRRQRRVIAESDGSVAAAVVAPIIDPRQDTVGRHRPDESLAAVETAGHRQPVLGDDALPPGIAADRTCILRVAQRHARTHLLTVNLRKATSDMASSSSPWRTTRTLVTPVRRRR